MNGGGDCSICDTFCLFHILLIWISFGEKYSMTSKFFVLTVLWIMVMSDLQAKEPAINIRTFEIYEKSSYLFTNLEDSVEVEDIVDRLDQFKEGPVFNRPYDYFEDAALWLSIPLEVGTGGPEEIYFVFENAYLFSGEAWLLKPDSALISSFRHSYKDMASSSRLSNYPTWKFELPSEGEYQLLVRIEDHETRTKITCALMDEEHFYQYAQQQLVGFSVFSAIVLMMVISMGLYAFVIKEPSLFFYCGYLIFFIFDYAAMRGFGPTYVWGDNSFLVNNIRSLSHGLIAFFGSLFFASFYKSIDPPKWVLWYFKGFALLLVPCFLIYLIKAINPWFPSFYLYFWSFLNANIVLMLGIHIFLAIQKKLPYYLIFTFSLIIVATLLRNKFIPDLNDQDWVYWIWNNAYYLAVILEVCMLTFFIYNRLSKRQSYLESALEDAESDKEALVTQLQNGNGKHSIRLKSKVVLDVDDLKFVKSDGHYLEFHLASKKVPEVDRNTFQNFEKEVEGTNVMKVHRSYMINLNYVRYANAKTVELKDGTEIPISRSMRQAFREKMDLL